MTAARLCLIVPTLDQGGAEKQLCLLAAGLPRDRFDVHVVVLTRSGPREAELRDAQIPVHIVGKASKFSPASLLRLTRLLRRLRPAIAHTWIFAGNSYGRVAARWAGVPHLVAGERCVDLWKTGRHFVVDRYLARWTDCIVTNSNGVVSFYAERGLNPKLFRVIPNGIPPRIPTSLSRDEAFSRLGIDPHRKVIAAIGRLWPQKRYRDLIDAVDLLGVVRPDTTLVIFGEGPQREALMRYRDQVTEADWVRFAGARTDVAELLPHFDLFWIGSGYEGQSNALMEAMQAGLPVLASDIPGNRDLIRHGEHGLLYPLGDTGQLARNSNLLLEDPAEALRLGRAAAERMAQEFTVDRMVARHAQLYEELLGGSPRR